MPEDAKPSRARRYVRELLKLSAFVVVLLSARWSLANHYLVPTGSMQPTVAIDDRILVNKAAYGIRVPFSHATAIERAGPAVGDVVVLDAPDEDRVLLKRVVATPGTSVEVRRGRIVLDGVEAPIEERADGLYERLGDVVHPVRLTLGGGPDYGPVTIPEGKYLVMGDNRGDSRDGRVFGLVERDAILGRAVGVFWRGGPTWTGL